MKKSPLITFLVLIFAANAQAINVKEGIPAGFEELAKDQKTMVTLRYGGELLGSFAAEYNTQKLTFADSAAIANKIPGLNERGLVALVLAQPLPINAQLLCRSRQFDCPRLEPQVAGIIFNEADLSAEVFVNRQLIDVSEKDGDQYLPLSDNGFSSIYGFSGAVSGVDGRQPSFTVNSSAVYSYDENKLETHTSFSDNGVRLDSLFAGFEKQGIGAGAGLFRSRPMQMVSDADIAGASFYSSTRTLLDKRKTEGNDVIIYLPRRAYISIYRDGRLYSSSLYDAGNQKVDTSELPEGAYNITLKIQEPDGNYREETRFFAKSPDIPPPGRPIYYAEAGVMRESAANDSAIPELTNLPLARAGFISRVDENAGLGIGLAAINDRLITEGNAFLVMPDSRISGSVLGSSRGDFGLQASHFYYSNNVSATVDARKLWLSKKADEGYNSIISDIEQATASVSFGVSESVYAGARASYSKNSNSAATTSFGPFAEWRLWQEGETQMAINADAARIDGKNEGNVIFRFTHRFGDYGTSGSIGQGFGENEGQFGNVRGWYEQNNPGSLLEVGATASADEKRKAIGADIFWRGADGQARGSVQQSFGESHAFDYAGNFSFGAATNGAELYLGGERMDKSAVAVSVKGNASGNMRILINGSPRSSVKIGESQVIYLSPFQTYRVQLTYEGDAMLDYESTARKVTLYPGNVARLEWDVNKYYVLLAKIADESGRPLVNALLEGTRTATDNKGRLQAELSAVDSMLFTTEHGKCNVTLPANMQDDNGIIILKEQLTCRKVN